jgi:hypothetical protein
VGTSGIPQESKSVDKELYSRKDLQKVIYSTEELRDCGYKAMRKKLNKNKLKNSEKKMIDELCESIVSSGDPLSWQDKLHACVEDSEEIASLEVMNEIQELSLRHELDLYSAALLYHSNKED